MPSIQWLVSTSFSPDSLAIAGLCNTTTAEWLRTYCAQRGIAFPMISDGASAIFVRYRVGSAYGKPPPTYVIIDQKGVVQYRIDDQFGKFDEMIAVIGSLL